MDDAQFELTDYDMIDYLDAGYVLACEVATLANAPVPSPFDIPSLRSQLLRCNDPSFYLVDPDVPLYCTELEFGLMGPEPIFQNTEDPVTPSAVPVPAGDCHVSQLETSQHGAIEAPHRSPTPGGRTSTPAIEESAEPLRRSSRLASTATVAGPSHATRSATCRRSSDSGYESCSSPPVGGSASYSTGRTTGPVRNARSRGARQLSPYMLQSKTCRAEEVMPEPTSESMADAAPLPVTCRLDDCGQLIECTRQTIRRHLKSHEGYFTSLGAHFDCPWPDGCKQKASHRKQLSPKSAPRHMLRHFGVDTHICPRCGEAVERLDGLLRHNRAKHGEDQAGSTEDSATQSGAEQDETTTDEPSDSEMEEAEDWSD
ncbi:hypothetical protein CERSUDRAFT_121672 [Gelatoporia subvermispora B]|uniref:C2H2-type domain-containing protein n=1 Tax=Ceriporiopsis subvermispora (strain B) TaxID=914234 RepID=M2RQG9_CERS8|nr:hypothetical protein CERSUDRAFT_121672 [Gelatoporia subvermispora B]